MLNGATKLHIFHPKETKPDIFDRVGKDIFDRTELDAKDQLLFDPKLQEIIDETVRARVEEEVKKAVAAIKLPEPKEPKAQIIKEVRVEVPSKDTRELVEKSALDAALKKIAELEKEGKETRRIAETPPFMPGGSGVIGIPPPEGNEGKTLKVSGNKAAWVSGGSGGGLSGYTVNNHNELKTFDVNDTSLDEVARILGSIITDLS